MGRMKSDLSFGLDFDIERVDPGGENSGEPLTGERVEEMTTRLGYMLESAPTFDHTNASLINATSDDAIRVPHFYAVSRRRRRRRQAEFQPEK